MLSLRVCGSATHIRSGTGYIHVAYNRRGFLKTSSLLSIAWLVIYAIRLLCISFRYKILDNIFNNVLFIIS